MRHDLSDEFDERRWKITLQAFQENLAIGISFLVFAQMGHSMIIRYSICI